MICGDCGQLIKSRDGFTVRDPMASVRICVPCAKLRHPPPELVPQRRGQLYTMRVSSEERHAILQLASDLGFGGDGAALVRWLLRTERVRRKAVAEAIRTDRKRVRDPGVAAPGARSARPAKTARA